MNIGERTSVDANLRRTMPPEQHEVASLRDQASGERDDIAEQQDQTADLRNRKADLRDRTAKKRDQTAATIGLTGVGDFERFLREIASDRTQSSHDLPQHPERGAVSVGFAELQPGDLTDDLVARAATALDRERRHRSDQSVAATWKCGNLVVDELACSTTRAGSPVFLTATEFSILVLLARNHTHVVPKRQLFNHLGGYGNDYHLLEVHISSLRRKLEVYGPRVIFTIRGTGYVLRP